MIVTPILLQAITYYISNGLNINLSPSLPDLAQPNRQRISYRSQAVTTDVVLTGWTLNLVLVFHSRQFWQRIASVYLAFALSGNSLPVICILMLFLGTANHLCVNLLITGLNTTDTSKRGAIMGLNSAVTYLAVFTGNTLFGALYLHWGYTRRSVSW